MTLEQAIVEAKKLSWKANYIAMDCDGQWKAFENPPVKSTDYWYSSGGNMHVLNTRNIDWRDSLRKLDV